MSGAALRQRRQGRDQARGLPSPEMEDQGFLPRAQSDAEPQTGFKTEPRRARRKDAGLIGGRPN